MRKIALFLFLIAVFACEEYGHPKDIRLVRTEFQRDNGPVFHTEYGYDGVGRITSITEYQDGEAPEVKVTITYEGNDVILFSQLVYDNIYIETIRVVLKLDGRGLTQKRIEYANRVNSDTFRPREVFIYDTLVFEYDGMGLLTKTTGSRYDSTSLMNPSATRVRQVTYTTNFGVESGNLSTSDELVVYKVVAKEGDNTHVSGGSSERRKVYSYAKAYPNKTDFSNAAILNEYKQGHEPYLNIYYKNMSEQFFRSTIDRDLNDEVFFSIEGTTVTERVYDARGLLSIVRIPANVQYTEFRYFYR
ncbi:hypothetical protein [Pararhodonellum marinum]|uniref:hypothetical protein n=1 Tax=Pararhodonellum marinum TaxID=2755358 RepID=UPI00188EF219|nr:hypothetical protein [Pararhodonellum marinum]